MIQLQTNYRDATQENRCAARITLAIPARMRVAGSQGCNTVIRNLSVAGFNVDAIGGMRPGRRCWLTISGLESLQSEVVWQKNGIAGCSFHSLLSPLVLESILNRHPSPYLMAKPV